MDLIVRLPAARTHSRWGYSAEQPSSSHPNILAWKPVSNVKPVIEQFAKYSFVVDVRKKNGVARERHRFA